MKFSCCECGGIIHGPALIVGKRFMHITCVNKEQEKEEKQDLEDIELEEA